MEPALQLLQHIAAVRQVMVLGDSINRLCARDPPLAILESQMPPRGHAQPLSQEDALVTYLVLQQGAMCQSIKQIKLCGKMGALWQSVYGVSDDITPLEQLYSSSFAQASSMALACTQLLEHVLLSTCTCFSILAAAWAAPAPCLAAAARRTAAKRFEQATASNARGFKALSAQQLLDVLQSEDLKVKLSQCMLQYAVSAQVTSCMTVFNAVVGWIMGDAGSRKQYFASLMEKGVRLDRMSRDELYLVDVHPLVVSSHEASMAVARVFLHRLMGSSWGPSSPAREAALQQPASKPVQPAGGAAGSNRAQVPSLGLQMAVGQEATPCTGPAHSPHFSRSASQQTWLITPASNYEAGRLSVVGEWPGPSGTAMQPAAMQPASVAGEVYTHARQALSSPVQLKRTVATAGKSHSSQLSERPAASMSKRRRLSFDE